MDEGVLESIKCQYWKKILEELVLLDENGTFIVDFLKGINMLKVTKMITAWNKIKERTFCLSWRKILPLEYDKEAKKTDKNLMLTLLHLSSNPISRFLGTIWMRVTLGIGCRLTQ